MTETIHIDPESRASSRRLDGWKVIGDYLGVTARTAQIWKKERSLPVHHRRGLRGQRAFAYTAELDAWLAHGSDTPNSSPGSIPALIWSARKSRLIIVTVGLVLCAIVILVIFSSWKRYAAAHSLPDNLPRLSIRRVYDGPPHPQGSWTFRALAFDGRFLWSAITQEGFASRLCQHNVDDRLSIVACHDFLTAYITAMGFYGSDLWAVDNYHDRFLKLGSPPSLVLEEYPIAGKESPNNFAIVGGNLWTIYPKAIAKFAIPPQRRLETIPMLGVHECGMWDGNLLWILDQEQSTLRRYKLDPKVAMVGIYRLPVEFENASLQLWGGCFVNGYLWLAEDRQYKIYQLNVPE